MLATLSLVIRHEALARRGETIYRKAPTQEMGWGFVLLLFVTNKTPLETITEASSAGPVYKHKST
jgi:hypothetical protein